VIVDAHVHLLPERLAAAIRRFFTRAAPPDYMLYPHEYGAARAALAAAGVARCWSLPYAHQPGMASALNRWMAETFADDAMVVPGATLHPADDVEAVLREALGTLGLPLVKLHCSVGDFAPDDPRLDTVWRRVSDGGQPVVVHAGHAVNGATSAEEIAPLARVARRWPAARIVVAHCGAPAVDAVLALVREAPAVHADLTPIGKALAPLTRQAIAGLERRLLFGSDAPNVGVSVGAGLAHVRALGLDAADEAAILGGTALALIPQPAPL
jgi:predicted TIM-barrel fold metal-dependent hydrolase